MEHEEIVQKIRGLSDVEIATLLCLIANQHCIIQTEDEVIDALQDELQLIASNVFGLSFAVIECSEVTTLEDFSSGVLKQELLMEELGPKKSPSKGRASSYKFEKLLPRDDRKLANIIIAKNLNRASHQVQILALELLRSNRIFTHTAVYPAPKPFLVVALNSSLGVPLVKHLNDHIFISHYHSPEDGFANLENGTQWIEDDRASSSSVVHRFATKGSGQKPHFTREEIDLMANLSSNATISVDVMSYLHNIVTFLRLHRAVAEGVTPRATQYFKLLVKCLIPFHSIDFATPSLVALAAPKIYRHRISLVSPEDERSMQFGSELVAVTALLADITPADVIEEVLAEIEVPV